MDRRFKMIVDDTEYVIDIRGNGMLVNDVPFVIGTQGSMVTADGIAYDVHLTEDEATVDGVAHSYIVPGFRLRTAGPKRNEEAQKEVGPGSVTALMPGAIVRILVDEGQPVQIGDVLLILEAMKMENEIQAEREGVIKKIHVAPGDRVETGQPMVDIE
jgi:glutaconyl-CoA/methylmalonyl-CoA decarboxylase subunit gamma